MRLRSARSLFRPFGRKAPLVPALLVFRFRDRRDKFRRSQASISRRGGWPCSSSSQCRSGRWQGQSKSRANRERGAELHHRTTELHQRYLTDGMSFVRLGRRNRELHWWSSELDRRSFRTRSTEFRTRSTEFRTRSTEFRTQSTEF